MADGALAVARSGAAPPIAAADVVPYLLGAGLLDAESVVRGRVRVEERSRRNLDYLVFDGNAGLFVKQGVGPAKRRTVAAEWCAYRVLAGIPCLRRYLVPARHFDAQRSIQVLDLEPSATSMRDHHVRTRRLSLLAARNLGRALAHLHDAPLPRRVPDALDRGPAEALALHRPTASVLNATSRAGRTVLGMIQAAPGLGEAFDALAADWRRTSLVHGDVRWDNCLVHPRPGSGRATRLKLVDWELARVGDPAWDLGSVFAEYIAAWATSIPASAELGPGRATDLAATPIESVHGAVRAFWRAYRATRSGDENPVTLRVRALRYAGCKLAQAGFERADRRAQLPTATVVCLQLGLNVLTRPLEGATHLLGLETGSGG